jgi:hypothetical protein
MNECLSLCGVEREKSKFFLDPSTMSCRNIEAELKVDLGVWSVSHSVRFTPGEEDSSRRIWGRMSLHRRPGLALFNFAFMCDIGI